MCNNHVLSKLAAAETFHAHFKRSLTFESNRTLRVLLARVWRIERAAAQINSALDQTSSRASIDRGCWGSPITFGVVASQQL